MYMACTSQSGTPGTRKGQNKPYLGRVDISPWCEIDFGVGGHGHVRKTATSASILDKHVLNANASLCDASRRQNNIPFNRDAVLTLFNQGISALFSSPLSRDLLLSLNL